MPRFRIICTTTQTYLLTVEAPSKEAAEKYYDGCTGEEFHYGEEEGWNLDEIVPLPDGGTGHDVEVDEDGEVIPAPATNGKSATELWEELCDTPINSEGCIEAPFKHFPVGTFREDIWEWFENTFSIRWTDLSSQTKGRNNDTEQQRSRKVEM